ncbi:MAG: PIG-L family deacetylase [Fimbriimonas sp.]|nr:PIG-L family deacetylase [Fimbriimonas sp.]
MRFIDDTPPDEPTPGVQIPEPRQMPTPEERARKRKRAMKIRLWFYGTVFGLLYFGLWYQPYEIDLVPRHIPSPNPRIDPDSNRLFAKDTRILVVTAHPDDSEFFIGGLLSQLAKSGAVLHQVICTNGDKGYYFLFTNAAQNRVVRQREARSAAAAWNAQSIDFLGYPDRWLHASDDVVAKLSAEIDRFKPEYILAFDGDYPPRASHQDHRRSGDAVEMAAKKTKVAKWLLLFSTIAPNYIVDISNSWEGQKRLLAIHKSQFYGKHLEGIENMVEYNAEKDGEKGGYDLGEGLRCIRLR